MRIANREYQHIQIDPKDSVIFSSSVIPGNERTVQNLKDQLYRQGAKVYHYKMMDIHASGHAYRDELKQIMEIFKPKFIITMHGQFSMLYNHAILAKKGGIKPENIKVVENGEIISLTPRRMVLEKETMVGS